MKSIGKYILPLLLMVVGYGANAQNDTSIKRKNVFTAGINYQSRLHYFGRVDSLRSQGVFPTIGFERKKGLYGTANFIFLNNQARTLDYTGSVIEGGYKFPESKNFSGNVFYSQFLYKKTSEVVQASLKAQTGGNFSYNNKIVNLTFGADAKFSDHIDFGLTGELDRLFVYVIPKTKTAIAINPSAYVYSGTQKFTQTYNRKRQLGNITLGQEQVTEEVQKFNVLSYELSMPIVLVAGKFNASLIPSYVMPQNLVTVPNRPDLSERGKNMFYVTAGVGLRL